MEKRAKTGEKERLEGSRLIDLNCIKQVFILILSIQPPYQDV
jgi:hypothetical protein